MQYHLNAHLMKCQRVGCTGCDNLEGRNAHDVLLPYFLKRLDCLKSRVGDALGDYI